MNRIDALEVLYLKDSQTCGLCQKPISFKTSMGRNFVSVESLNEASDESAIQRCHTSCLKMLKSPAQKGKSFEQHRLEALEDAVEHNALLNAKRLLALGSFIETKRLELLKRAALKGETELFLELLGHEPLSKEGYQNLITECIKNGFSECFQCLVHFQTPSLEECKTYLGLIDWSCFRHVVIAKKLLEQRPCISNAEYKEVLNKAMQGKNASVVKELLTFRTLPRDTYLDLLGNAVEAEFVEGVKEIFVVVQPLSKTEQKQLSDLVPTQSQKSQMILSMLQGTTVSMSLEGILDEIARNGVKEDVKFLSFHQHFQTVKAAIEGTNYATFCAIFNGRLLNAVEISELMSLAIRKGLAHFVPHLTPFLSPMYWEKILYGIDWSNAEQAAIGCEMLKMAPHLSEEILFRVIRNAILGKAIVPQEAVVVKAIDLEGAIKELQTTLEAQKRKKVGSFAEIGCELSTFCQLLQIVPLSTTHRLDLATYLVRRGNSDFLWTVLSGIRIPSYYRNQYLLEIHLNQQGHQEIAEEILNMGPLSEISEETFSMCLERWIDEEKDDYSFLFSVLDRLHKEGRVLTQQERDPAILAACFQRAYWVLIKLLRDGPPSPEVARRALNICHQEIGEAIQFKRRITNDESIAKPEREKRAQIAEREAVLYGRCARALSKALE